jgi:hypothetical protein
MIIVLVYFISVLSHFGFTFFIYAFRRQNFKNTIIKELNKRVEREINGGWVIFTLSIFMLFVLNYAYFGSPEGFGSELEMLVVNMSQIIFFSSFIFFVKSVRFIPKEGVVEFVYPSRSVARGGDIIIGNILHKNKVKYPYYLSLKDLAQHMFICGTTGSGKSTFVQNFLTNFKEKYDIPFLLAEFKGEYHFLQKIIADLLILKVGENFSINIFDPEGTDSEVHAERVFQIFRSGGLFEGVEYTPQMERVFVDILREVCKDPSKRSWQGFYDASVVYGVKAGTSGKMATSDYMFKQSVTAVQNRIRRYSLGTLKHIFEKKTGLDVTDLFKYNVLLDLSSIINLGGEKEDTLFFLNMFFKYLWDENLRHGSRDYTGIRHITIIEDAQYFASQSLSKVNKLTSYMEDVALVLRGTGECLISLATRANVSVEILANCGVFVTFQNHLQKDFLEELLNLGSDQKSFLSMLNTGDCIIRVNSIGKPFAMRIPFIERSWLTDDEIEISNQKILDDKLAELEGNIDSKLEEFNKNDLIEKIYCEFCGVEMDKNSTYCTLCFSDFEMYQRFKKIDKEINELYEKEQEEKHNQGVQQFK